MNTKLSGGMNVSQSGSGSPFDSVPHEHLFLPARVSIPLRIIRGGEGKAPIVLLHGLQSHSTWFLQSAADLAGMGHSVYAFDRRGSGESPELKGHSESYQDMLEDIDAVASFAKERENAEKVHLLGHCFGSLPAAVYAARNPSNVLSLVLTSPAIYTHVSPTPKQYAHIVSCLFRGSKERIPFPFSPEMFTDSPTYLSFMTEDRLALDGGTAGLYLAVYRLRRAFNFSVDKLTMPTLILLAGKDVVAENTKNRTVFDRIRAERKLLIEYPESHHLLEFSPERERMATDIARWCATAEQAKT